MSGIFGAGVLFSASLMPSLIPRDPVIQGVLSGLVAALGFWLGLLVYWLWTFLELPRPSGKTLKKVQFTALALVLGMAVYALWQGFEWQDRLRAFLDLPPPEGSFSPTVVLIALPVALFLRELGRGFVWTTNRIVSVLNKLVPPRLSLVVGIVLAAVLLGNLVSGTIGRFTLRSLDAMFLALDQIIEDDLPRPQEALATGSPASTVSWEDLGRQGRLFVGSGPDRAEIEAFTGAPAQRPIRVYVGLGAAETVQERAELALEEMKRQGAFDRSVLVIATPTGTGWIDQEAVDPLEYLHRGDTAIVAQQYSYLTSYVSLFVEPGYSTASAEALFNVVYGYWTDLPKDSRPRLYLHGLSLGAAGSEQSMNIFSVLGDLFHGAVWSGPPFSNPYWTRFTRGRNPGTPFWRPVYQESSLVRFTNQDNALDIPGADWGPVRLVYLQYASDPITFFSPDIFYREPDWLKSPRGPDVSPDLRWFPIVTGVQIAFDMIGASGLGTGIGHLYAASHYIDAWVEVTEPEGWSAADLDRLKQEFAQ